MRTVAPRQSAVQRPSCQLPLPCRSVAAAMAAGLALRLWLFLNFSLFTGDSLIYGDIAKNLLLFGKYALTDSGVARSTLIRLPGYPLLVTGFFRLFGLENYAVLSGVQIALDLAGCLLLAAFVGRIATRRAALYTLWLAALCPFTASYAGTPLTEAPTLFAIALALWSMAAFSAAPGWGKALLFTLAVVFAALLRPDGALVALALAPPVAIALYRQRASVRRPLALLLVCLLLALAPFAAWSWRNWKTFHVFQPLAPRLANDPGEDPHLGWHRWVKSWCQDFDCTYNVYWVVPGGRFDLSTLPATAFDTPAQRTETESIVARYNSNGYRLTAELTERFNRLADARKQSHPLRYYIGLPLTRVADMWLRPRDENLPLPLEWSSTGSQPGEFVLALCMAGLNVALLLLGLAGLWLRPRFWGWMLLYFLLRSALLMSVQAPEARYTLECFPMLLSLGGIALARWAEHRQRGKAKSESALC